MYAGVWRPVASPFTAELRGAASCEAGLCQGSPLPQQACPLPAPLIKLFTTRPISRGRCCCLPRASCSSQSPTPARIAMRQPWGRQGPLWVLGLAPTGLFRDDSHRSGGGPRGQPLLQTRCSLGQTQEPRHRAQVPACYPVPPGRCCLHHPRCPLHCGSGKGRWPATSLAPPRAPLSPSSSSTCSLGCCPLPSSQLAPPTGSFPAPHSRLACPR